MSASNIIAHPGPAGAYQRGILMPQTFGELVQFAELAANSGMVPRDYKDKPGAIIIAVQMGSELGLSPTQALQSIAVINGRPGVWGDGLIGLCRGSPLCEDIIETIEGEGDARTATCIAKRRGATPVTHTFSVADAKKAGLWQAEARVTRRGQNGSSYETANDSPWFRYPDRMLQNRARGFALRDAFPDVLRGLKTVEELIDTPRDSFKGTTIDYVQAQDQPQRQPASPPEEPVILGLLRERLAQCHTEADVVAVGNLRRIKVALEQAPKEITDEINALLSEAYERVLKREPSIEIEADGSAEDAGEDDFPGDKPR
jgi:hypothetical protein